MSNLLSNLGFVARFAVITATISLSGFALPILPGNEHPHNDTVTTWSSGDKSDPAIMHQHWNDLPLGVNNGEDSWFANKAWDNNGDTTAFHAPGTANFGHGYIANQVYFFFDAGYSKTDAFDLRVEEAFSDWVLGAMTYYGAAGRPDVTLGFNFVRATKRPTIPYINVKFGAIDADTTGEFDSSNQTITFNTADFTWYTGAAAPGAGDGRDFLTTARHEVGHSVGFGHNKNAAKVLGSSIMWSSAAPMDTRIAITDGDFQGVMALYTEPVPEPSAVWGGLVAIGFVALRRRKR